MYMYIYIFFKIVIFSCENYIWVEKFYFNFMILAEQFPWNSDPNASPKMMFFCK